MTKATYTNSPNRRAKGRILFDIQKEVQKGHNLESYKLDNVAAHFMRGKLYEINGEYHVIPLDFQGSHSIGSLVEANALIRVEANSPELPKGSQVSVRPLKNEIV